MHYLSVAEAKTVSGMRLVLTAGVPGPWGEAAKAVMRIRGVAFHAVAQDAMAPNLELLEWTGHRNAPVACLDDEPPLCGWLDIVLLAQRLGSGPSLLPADALDRALCLGLVTEIAGRDGLGWNRRTQIMGGNLIGPEGYSVPDEMKPMVRAYEVTEEAISLASARIATILNGLVRPLEAGSEYLVGDVLSVADIYWACFSMMFRPLPADVNAMPDWLRLLYNNCDETVESALNPLLIAHRDRIYSRHIGLPLDY
jgi:glutathione S-transferase